MKRKKLQNTVVCFYMIYGKITESFITIMIVIEMKGQYERGIGQIQPVVLGMI